MANQCDVRPRPKGTREILRSWYFWKPVLSLVGGALIGFMFYYLQACDKPGCPINADVWQNIISGAFIGYFIVNRPCCSC